MLRPGKDKGIATPIPLGLAVIGVSTFLMAFAVLFQNSAVWLPYFTQSILFGGIVALLAGMWAFAYGDPLGATAFSFLGAFFGWLGITNLNFAPIHAATTAGAFNVSTGMVMIVAGCVLLYLWVASFHESAAFNGTLLFLATALELFAINLFTGSTVIAILGGIAALISSAFAFYGSFGEVYNATALQEVVPIGEPTAVRERSLHDEQERIRRIHAMDNVDAHA